MLDIASFDEIFNASQAIRGYVDAHESRPISVIGFRLETLTTPLETPRTIGEKTAKFLTLTKGISGGFLASALYEQELNTQPYTGDAKDLPLRSLVIMAEGPVVCTFNDGTEMQDCELTSVILDELLIDIAAS